MLLVVQLYEIRRNIHWELDQEAFNYEWKFERIEYQRNLWPHIHQLKRETFAPDTFALGQAVLQNYKAENKVDTVSDAERRQRSELATAAQLKFEKFVDHRVTCLNDAYDVQGNDLGYQKPSRDKNILYRMLSDVPENERKEDIIHVQNTVQKHKCMQQFCLKKGTCREKYPKQLCPTTYISVTSHEKRKKSDQQHFSLEAVYRTNDVRTVPCSLMEASFERRNRSKNVLVDSHHAVNYVSKYVTKVAKRHEIEDSLMQDVMKNLSDDSPALQTVTKTMMRNLTSRAYGLPEVLTILMGIPLVRYSIEN